MTREERETLLAPFPFCKYVVMYDRLINPAMTTDHEFDLAIRSAQWVRAELDASHISSKQGPHIFMDTYAAMLGNKKPVFFDLSAELKVNFCVRHEPKEYVSFNEVLTVCKNCDATIKNLTGKLR